MSDSCSFNVGEMIGDYEIIKPLGLFSNGEVYLVKHKMLQIQSVARVFFSQELLHDSQADFLHRMQSLYTLRHPNIVGVTFFAQYPEKNFSAVFSEYAEGTTLAGYMKSNPAGMAISQALEITGKISSALAEISAHNLIHNNIRSSNVFLTADHGVKLSDLESACSNRPFSFAEAASKPELLPAPESLQYYAPEKILNGSADIRSDIYSLGMILYFMLAGKFPFRSQVNVLLIGEILYAELPAPGTIRKEIPPALDKFVLRLTAKKQEDRPQTPEQLQQELTALLQELSGKTAASAPQTPGKPVPAPPKNGVPKLQLRMPSAAKSVPAQQPAAAVPPPRPAQQPAAAVPPPRPAQQPAAAVPPPQPATPPKAEKSAPSPVDVPDLADFGEIKGNEEILVSEIDKKNTQVLPFSWKNLPSMLWFVGSKSVEITRLSFQSFLPVILLCLFCGGVAAWGLATDIASLICGVSAVNSSVSSFRAYKDLPGLTNGKQRKIYQKVLAGEGDFDSIRLTIHGSKGQETLHDLSRHDEPDACLIAATLKMLQFDGKEKYDDFLPLMEKAAERGSLEAAGFLYIWHKYGGDPQKAETYEKQCLALMKEK